MQIDGAVETRDKQMLPPQLALTEVHLHCLRCDVEEQANSAPLSSILDQVEGVVSAATLDDIANVCIAAAQQHPSIVCRALKLALGEELNLQMQQEIPSLRSYGKIIQRLVTHTQRLPESTASEQTLHFLKKARDIVKRSDSAYPATEVITCHACVHLPTETVLVATDSWRHMTTWVYYWRIDDVYICWQTEWLMVTAWNEGARLVTNNKHKRAQAWLTTAMTFMEYVPDYPDATKRKMSASLTDVLTVSSRMLFGTGEE
jgi:hypothetical protein